VDDVEYDKSAMVYSTNISVRIEDKSGKFLGVLKAILNIEATISPLREAAESHSVHLRLITADDRVIYATKEYSILEPLPEGVSFNMRQGYEGDYSGYFISRDPSSGQNESLFALAGSEGFRDYEGLGWVLVVQHDIKDVLAPVSSLRQRALYVLLGVTIVAIVLGLFITRSVSNSLKKLTNAALTIGEGDLSARVEVRSNDEVGQLTRVFNNMTGNLQTAMDELEREVIDRTQAEENLRREKEFTETALDSQRDTFFLFEPATGAAVRWNDAFRNITGYTDQEITSMPALASYYGPEDIQRAEVFLQEVMKTGGGTIELTLICKDGRKILTEYNVSIISDASGEAKYIISIGRDITDRKRAEAERLNLERQVQHAQKLESLGVLAGGIAHDFNNLLMAILGNADLAMDELPPHAPARNNLTEIENAAKRAADLSKQMLAYSGKGKFVIASIRLNEFVEEMAHLLDVSISKKVILKYNFADNLPAFDGDATQIRQIIMNLITNASEAIGDTSGVIALSTGALHCDRAYLDAADRALHAGRNALLSEGLYVYLEVADTGCGMDTETIEKIFDPFFTTKFTGRGLGMAAVLGIVRGHDGLINIYSEKGKGTTFKVLFPASGSIDADGAAGLPGEEEAQSWTGHGTVLIADDEDTVCAVGRQMLEKMGFSVLIASDGRQAVDLFGLHADQIACVLLDLTMPRMDGQEAFAEMRNIRPDVAVILCSGYNEQDATQHFAGKGLAGFVQKPYSMVELRDKLMEILPESRKPGPNGDD
jgi:PAS domain S-box-containing protein